MNTLMLIFKIDVDIEVRTYTDYLKLLLNESEEFKLEIKLMLDKYS